MEQKNTKSFEDFKQRLKVQAEQNFKNLLVQYKQGQQLIYQLVAVNQVLSEERNRLLKKIERLKSKARTRRKKVKNTIKSRTVNPKKENGLLLGFKKHLNSSVDIPNEKEQPSLDPPSKPKR